MWLSSECIGRHGPTSRILLHAVVLCWLTAQRAADANSAAHRVLELTASDFDARVQGGRESPWFVKFYAPWCGHCQRMASDWERVSVDLYGSVNVARVDATREKALAEAWDVSGFPTLRLIANNKVYNYKGARTFEKLREFASYGWRSDYGEALPGAETNVVSLTGATFEEQIARDMDVPWFVLFFVPWCEHCQAMADDWEQLSKRLSGTVRVAKVDGSKESNSELSAKFVSFGFPTMKLIVAGEVHTYDGPRAVDDMQRWVEQRLPPPPSLLQQLLQWRIYGRDPLVPLAFIVGSMAALLGWYLTLGFARKEVASPHEQAECEKKAN